MKLQEVRTSFTGDLYSLFKTPSIYLGMVSGEKDLGYFPVKKYARLGILRILKNAGGMRLILIAL